MKLQISDQEKRCLPVNLLFLPGSKWTDRLCFVLFCVVLFCFVLFSSKPLLFIYFFYLWWILSYIEMKQNNNNLDRTGKGWALGRRSSLQRLGLLRVKVTSTSNRREAPGALFLGFNKTEFGLWDTDCPDCYTLYHLLCGAGKGHLPN